MAEFVRSHRGHWPSLLARFALVFILVSVVWWLIAPYYARVLAALGSLLIPVLEPFHTAAYSVDGARVWAVRWIVEPGASRPSGFKAELWRGYANYNFALFTALILATPAWSLRQRAKLLAIGLGFLSVVEFAFFLSSIEFTQGRVLPGRSGPFVAPGFSGHWQVVFTWVYYFFQIMGRGLFPLLLYYLMLGMTWKPAVRPEVQRVAGGSPDPPTVR